MEGIIFQIQNDPLTICDWVHERDHYTRIQKNSKIFASRKYIFVVECKPLTISVANEIMMQILVIVFVLIYALSLSAL